jgi:nucleotide-binding universal stress UspA family protein
MMPGKILVAIDGSEHAWKAVELAADLARARDAEVIVLHVVPFEPLPESLVAFARAENIRLEEVEARQGAARMLGDALTREAERRLAEKGVTRRQSLVLEGGPASTILATASDEAVDMIVLGSRGRSPVAGAFLGSVSHKVAHLADCTCIVVK